jgi:hypothetical protein
MPVSFRSLLLGIGLLLIGALSAAPAAAQGYFDQYALEDLLSTRAEELNDLPEVYYEYVTLDEEYDNHVIARNRLYQQIGDGDTELGRKRSQLIELMNRQTVENTPLGDTLVAPTRYGLDFRAYSPFPRYYPGAHSLEKLFIIHKRVQAFAAYEYGKLMRWGIVNTGDPDSTATPNGRFNFNWKEKERVSTLSPPGEEWRMRWVFNFVASRGIHIHQYSMPTGGPASHGCVRLVDADAKWIYDWAEPWNTTQGHMGPSSMQGKLLDPGTMVLVLGDEPEGDPEPFIYKERYPVLKRVDFPTDPYAVPPGTNQQKMWDRLRAQRQATR